VFDHLLQEDGDALLLEYSDTILSGRGDYFILLDTAGGQYLWIQNTSAVSGTSYEGRMRLGTFAFTECAEMGRVGTGGCDLDENMQGSADAMPDPPAMQSAIFNDFRASDVRVFSGYTHSRNTERIGRQPSGKRQFGVELLDLNTLADDFVLTESDSADRPAETDYARVTWLLTVGFSTGAGVTAGQVPNTNTITMDAIDYRGRKPREVLDQCAEVTGKNWFLYNWAGLNKLYYDLTANAIAAPGLSSPGISDDPSDVIGSTTIFAPSGGVTVTRRPDEVYSKVHLTWAGGVVTAENTTTRDTYRRREVSIIDMGVRTSTTAQAKADEFLASSAVEKVTVSDLTIVVPETMVNAVRAGQLVSLKLGRHDINSESYFVTRRTVRSFKGSDTEYAITLTLVNALAPTRYLYQRGSNEVWEVKSNATPDGASVVVNRDGITVTQGAITVTNGDEVVIIDGTSNMFKIAAEGTQSNTASTGTTTNTDTTLTALGALDASPAHMFFYGDTASSTGFQGLGPRVIQTATLSAYVASSSGGSPTSRMVGMNTVAAGTVRLDGSDQAVVRLTLMNASGSDFTQHQKYFVLAETVF
jgi:hypothetical protein